MQLHPARRRLFFATDLHGSTLTFRKFLRAAPFYGADTLICGGDLSGKMLVPLVRGPRDTYRARLHGQVHELRGEGELRRFQERLEVMGHYWLVCEEAELRAAAERPDLVGQRFLAAARERLASWVEMAEEQLAKSDVHCYLSGGNDDAEEVAAVIAEGAGERVVACEGRAVELAGGYIMVSLPHSNPTPWKTARELPEDELAQRIDGLLCTLAEPDRTILNFHVPPIRSGLDTCPKLDEGTDPPSPVMEGGRLAYTAAGSQAVRQAIERYQPLLGLHGHIHASRGMTRLGRAVCFNPGSEYGEGILLGVTLTLERGHLRSYQFSAG